MYDAAALIAAVRSGDAGALGQMYERYADLVYGVAYRVTGGHADAEDVLQDVFVGLPEALRGYEERGSFAAWLKRVTARTALMVLRSQRRLRESDISDAHEVAETAPRVDIEDRLTAANAIARLPDALRVVFMLKEVEGYSHAEIAELLDISASASAVRLFRAWQQLLPTRV
jgi:RNA polymerase sigma-70 factor (ECF subfamily)